MESSDAGTEAWTVARLLAWTRDYFERSGLESPRLCAELLLAHALGCQRIQLYTRHESVPGPDVLATFRATVQEAAAGKPIAYLTGTKEFFSLTFEVTPDVLIPRPETEVLVERTIELVRRSPRKLSTILDLGTGSGCIVVSLAKHLPDVCCFASDISEPTLQVALRNAQRHGVADRIEFRTGDLFAPWTDAEGLDIVVCNPPYVAESDADSLPACVRDYEPAAALFAGQEGLGTLRRVIDASPHRLKPGGHLLLEVAFNQASDVRGLLDESIWDDIVSYPDGLKHERVVHARLRDIQRTRET